MEATLSPTVAMLRERYCAHAERYYRRRDGEPTREHLNLRSVLNRFVAHVGEAMPGERINRHQVKAWMDQLAAEGLSRSYINQCLQRVRRWVRWCCDLDLIHFTVTVDLQRVHPLRAFRTPAREYTPPEPPSLSIIDAVILHLPPRAADVLRVVRLTGARPSEVLELRTCEVITDDPPRIDLGQHKAAHHGHQRVIPLPPAALEIIRRHWLPLLAKERVFRSAESKRGHYSIDAFRAAVHRACKKAGVSDFTPYLVRHAVARHVRRKAGLDAAQALLGHSSAETTEIYAPLRAGQPDALDAARRATEVL